MRLLEDAFVSYGWVPEEVAKRLLGSAARDVHELLPFLEERGAEVSADARQQLAARAESEAKAMYDILAFVVLDGGVDMHYHDDDQERVERLTPGRVCYAEVGDEHVA